MVDETVARHGGIDILVNNAGLYASLAMRPFTEIPLEEWRRVMDVNVASMFLTCRAVVPVMRERGGGKIVNISSGTPFRGVPFLLHYVTSKGAIVALTRALAKELGKDGVHVNCVAPGFTMSDGVKAHPEVIEKLQDAVGRRAHDPARPGAGGRRRRGRLPLHPGGRLRHRPDDGHRRRPVLPLILALHERPEGVVTEDGPRVVYDLERNEARLGATRVDGPALVWELVEDPGAGGVGAALRPGGLSARWDRLSARPPRAGGAQAPLRRADDRPRRRRADVRRRASRGTRTPRSP